MLSTALVIRNAAQDIGLYVSEGDAVPGDIYAKLFECLKQVVAELNTQSAISFGQEIVDVSVDGDKLTFSLDPGPDTLEVPPPVLAPTVFLGGQQLVQLRIEDVLGSDSTTVGSFAFNILANGDSELIFNKSIDGRTLKVIYRPKITVDEQPYGNISVPSHYQHYLVTKLAEIGARAFQFYETAQELERKANNSGAILGNNNVSHEPINFNLRKALNKFRAQ
jgi:hypothetical protein